jgi:ABC-type transport system involved in Fe-S cluster assembly fused permease/ATPase subunit
MLTDLPADYETDAVIQESLRTELTVITIAHRPQTIMDLDKIIGATRCISSSLTVNHQVLDGA